MKRVREKGPRRRCSSNHTLVRTIPHILQPPPPIPLSGFITRAMRPAAITDTESLSTASWSTGQSGLPGTGNANCLYHFYTTPNQRTETVEHIMQPIRWTIAAPETDGGTYDFWANSTPSSRKNPLMRSGPVSYFGRAPITNTLLPAGSHAIWKEDYTLVNPVLNPFPCQHNNTVIDPFAWREVTFSNLAATTQSWGYALGAQNGGIGYIQIAAIRHSINLVPQDLILNPGFNFGVDPAWRVDVAPGDIYECDVWYRITTLANASAPAIPGKACAYIPLTQVSNGREIPAGEILFKNADFSPSFNWQEETYRVTVSGHSGWTLKDGSDGPHKMITEGGWTAAIGPGEVRWRKTLNNGYVSEIRLTFDREIVHAELVPGPLMSCYTATGALYYRADSGGDYRSTTNATWLGGIVTHAESGLFDQAGTTTFNLVPWSIQSAASGGVCSEGYRGGASPLPAIDVPTSLTFTKVTQ